MLIILDESLASELELTKPSSGAILAALTICAQQVREGNHILFAERNVYRRLRAFHKSLDTRSASILARAEERLPQLGVVNKFSTRSIRLIAACKSSLPSRVIRNGREEIILPAKSVEQNSSLLNVPILMVENLNDGLCYVKLAQSIANSKVLPELAWLKAVPLRYDIAPGGGHTLSGLFAYHKARSDRLGAAIADSDCSYPGSAHGGTALALTKEARATPVSPLLEAHVLDVRTIENCIPRAEIRLIVKEMDPVQVQRFEQIERQFSTSSHWRFVPIKSGVRCFELSQSSAESIFWTEICGKRTCTSGAQCAKKRDCSSYVVPPLSDQILARAVRRPDLFSVTERCSDNVADTWKRLVILLYSVFCGSERITVL